MAKDPYKGKSKLQKAWYFLWEDDSFLSWAVNVVIAFVVIKYMLYPGLGLLFGTSHPVVAVVSGSMEHQTVPRCVQYFNNDPNSFCLDHSPNQYKLCDEVYDERQRVDFDFFWEACGDYYWDYDINKEEFASFPMSNGFNTGDIIVLTGKEPQDIDVGEVIVFVGNRPDPIIHRVIDKWQEPDGWYFKTKGDHNEGTLSFEESIHEDRVIGRATFRIPLLGYIKIWFVKLLQLLGLNSTVGRLFN